MKCGESEYLMPGAFKKHAEAIYNMEVRPDDVWVITYPRSGKFEVSSLKLRLFNRHTPEGNLHTQS